MSAVFDLIAIVGPTASGKSSLANTLAKKMNAAVVSVDAMQIYRGMDIGTAKENPKHLPVPLYMVDIASLDESYSVELFQKEARQCIDHLLSLGIRPILCGGSGLYLDAVIDEMNFQIVERDEEKRKHYEAMASDEGGDALYALLQQRDPKSAALIHPHNVRRVIRALELADKGASYAYHHQGLKEHLPHYKVSMWGIQMNRERLYERINKRVDEMFASGLVEEVKNLSKSYSCWSQTAKQAIGYKEVLEYLEKKSTLEETKELIKKRTRRYAKRQLSWMRRDGRVRYIDYDQMDENQAAELILSTLQKD